VKKTSSPYRCRFCSEPLRATFVDLGMSPLCQTHIAPEQLDEPEQFYPLHTFVCEKCFLVQLPEHVAPKAIFEEYAYFSSYADTRLKQSKDFAEAITKHLGLNAKSLVVELASNDGYLLQYFQPLGIPVLGIEPAKNVAAAAIQKGIETITEFFGRDLATRLSREGRAADLIIGNNVLAHVPDLNDFVAGMKLLLKPRGVLTMEFPHLLRLIEGNQFDTIYHEHFSYFSFTTVEQIFAAHGLTLFDVEEISAHGGSLRIHGRHTEDASKPITAGVTTLRKKEIDWGVSLPERYQAFGDQVGATKRKILEFFIDAKNAGKSVAGYGAPGKGNTLLNYCGIRTDFLDYTVDRIPLKQGKFTPGTRIPIYSPDQIRQTKPDFLFILAWNLKDEVMQQNAFIREWGGKFVVPIPEVRIYD
jgi:SAM-dependent methyltransferase